MLWHLTGEFFFLDLQSFSCGVFISGAPQVELRMTDPAGIPANSELFLQSAVATSCPFPSKKFMRRQTQVQGKAGPDALNPPREIKPALVFTASTLLLWNCPGHCCVVQKLL